MKGRQTRRRHSRWAAVSIATAIALVGAACGSSENSAGGTAGSADIKIGLGALVVPGSYDANKQYTAGINAALGYIDEHGGWDGHRVETVGCTSPGDPASDLKCYREFIDEKTVAVLGLMSSSSTYLPKLEAAGIPSFVTGNTVAEEESSWHIGSPGIIESYTTTARYACAKGVKNITIFQQDYPTARAAQGVLAAGIFTACGIQVNNVYMPFGTADPAPYVQQAVSTKPDLLFISGQALPITTFLATITAAGFPIDKVITVPTGTKGWLADPKAPGIRIITRSGYPVEQSTDPDVQTFLKYMQKYSPGTDPVEGSLSLPAFSQILMIWDAAKAIGFDKLTGQALHDYMNNEAPGKLKIFSAHGTVVVPPRFVGVKDPYQRVLRWTGTELADEGWWASDWACTSVTDCASLDPPTGSKA